ncbi:MAG: orotidine-5'-phosphate decarboxylase [Gammaproteobacteria bacterium]|nr:orotidine-5'-phosphate decarboxylase [Gammaproteobacteria bacterium]
MSGAAQGSVIVALDVPDAARALDLADRLGDEAQIYKLGLELLVGGDFWVVADALRARGKAIFADVKLFDIPATVARAVTSLVARGVDFVTVHGNQAILEAAVAAARGRSRVLAVTVLTCLDEGDVRDLGFGCDIPSLVLSRARRALEAGADGVVASVREAAQLRATLGPRLLVVTPGVRPVLNREEPIDDQKRTASVEDAARAGADHIVVGRPVRDAADPRSALAAINSVWRAARRETS